MIQLFSNSWNSNSPSASNVADDAARIVYTHGCATFTARCAQYCVLYEENKMCSKRQSNVMDTIRRRDVGVGEKIKQEKGGVEGG